MIEKNIVIAALCHDLGHGPYSHMFDNKLLPRIAKKQGLKDFKWSHENASSDLFLHMVQKNKLGIEPSDIEIIQHLIHGVEVDKRSSIKFPGWAFDIVANKRNGIDVDKFDYITRDSYHIGLKDTYFDYKSLIKESRIINNTICFPEKLAMKVYELFLARYKLYKNIYHHKVQQGIELMLCDIFEIANEEYNFLECIKDMNKYMMLTDNILRDIEISKSKKLIKAQELIKRIKTRDIYRYVGEILCDFK